MTLIIKAGEKEVSAFENHSHSLQTGFVYYIIHSIIYITLKKIRASLHLFIGINRYIFFLVETANRYIFKLKIL
ncbi:MAG: hypothetical protein GXO39_10170 [Thermotogae bacterium]|nr:hypothetical protein [Thermotogota bacterium]